MDKIVSVVHGNRDFDPIRSRAKIAIFDFDSIIVTSLPNNGTVRFRLTDYRAKDYGSNIPVSPRVRCIIKFITSIDNKDKTLAFCNIP